MPASCLDSKDLPDSVYTQELRRGRTTRFQRPLEDEYIASHLAHVRTRVRAWFSLTSLIAFLVTIAEVRRSGLSSLSSLLNVGLLVPCGAAMAWLCWSSAYKRLFARAAPYLVSIAGVASAVSIARGLAAGRGEELSALTTTLLAVFFFSGLMFRQTLVPAAATLLAFLTASIVIGVPQTILAESLIALGLTGGVSVLVARDIDCAQRKSFLEGAIIGELVARDGLSGLMNRRTFDEHLLRVWKQAMRDQRTLAVLMVDIDHFKRYNDTHGHLLGDATLRSVAKVVQSMSRRPLDLAARYGGEEFAVILYDLAAPHVLDVAERLCQGVRNIRIQALEEAGSVAGPHVTVSIGVGIAAPAIGRTPQGAVQLADEALYQAKQAGRDRVVVRDHHEYGLLETGEFKAVRG